MAYTEFYIDGSHGSASNINGGSSSGAPLITKTNGNWNTTTKVFTVGAGDTLTSDMVGHFACVCNDGTTVGAYFARVTAIDNSAKTVTLSTTATIGTAPSTATTGKTIRVGGCWAGMSGATLFPFTLTSSAANLTNLSGDAPRFNFKGSYSITTGITMPFLGVSGNNGPFISGYSSVAGDGTCATFNYTGSGNSPTMTISGSGSAPQIFVDAIEFKNESTSATITLCVGLKIDTNPMDVILTRCKWTNTKAQGVYVSTSTNTACLLLDGCEFANCGNGHTSNGGGMLVLITPIRCSIRNTIFRNASGNTAALSISGPNGQVSIDDSVFCDNSVPAIYFNPGAALYVSASVFYGNSGGILVNTGAGAGSIVAISRSVFDSNSYALNTTTSSNNNNAYLQNCGYYNNTAKFDSNSSKTVEVDCFDFSASPLVDAANGDYRTRSTMGRNRVNGTITNSSKSLTTKRYLDVGIGPSNPFYRQGQ
jgi:hypothetical protein